MRSRDYERPLIFGLLAAVAGSLLVLSYESMEVLDATRAYVGGEGLWSKAQKNALLHVLRYAQSGDEAEFEAYRVEIAVTLADRAAREELEKPRPDLDVARRGFVGGRNDPEDVDGMILLFRRFRHLRDLDRAIGIWKAGDDDIQRFREAADRLHDEVVAGGSDGARLDARVDELLRLNADLTRLETEFSAALGEGARWTGTALFDVQIAAGLLLLGLSGTAYVLWRRRLRASEEEFRQLLEQAADGIVLTDLSGRIEVVNSRACEMLGSPSHALTGRRFADLIVAGDGPPASPLEDAAASRPVMREAIFRRAGGGSVPVEISARRVDRRIQAILRDVSERKAAEQALRTSEERLRQATKMEAVGRLAGGVAHDFNNVLAAIVGHAERLASDPAATPTSRRAAAEIDRAAERAAALTLQLLAFSRHQVVEPRTIDLGEVVRETEGTLRTLAGASVELSVRTSPSPLWIRADRGQVEQILVNLALNARDAMPRGGPLAVEAGELDRSDPADDGPRGRCARLTVTDGGVGMDAAVRSRAFEPFFTTKGVENRTGLGLSTVYGIVRQGGGSIALDSEPGRGTAVRVDLPLVEPPPAAKPGPPPATPAAAPRDGGGETVLLAEDEPALRELFGDVLRGRGYRVLVAADGLEALRIASARAEPIDALVSDVVMPGLSGPELLRQLRLVRPALPALLISGYTADALAPWGGLPDGVSFLQKPCSTEALAREVRAVLDGTARRTSS